MPIVIVAWCALLTVVATHAACDRARRRLRLWWHRHLTRKHGHLLQRARIGGEA